MINFIIHVSNHTLQSAIKAAVIGTDFACTITAVIGILFYGLTDCDCNHYTIILKLSVTTFILTHTIEHCVSYSPLGPSLNNFHKEMTHLKEL